eukprot:5374912-Prymnesium_polylepis.1
MRGRASRRRALTFCCSRARRRREFRRPEVSPGPPSDLVRSGLFPVDRIVCTIFSSPADRSGGQGGRSEIDYSLTMGAEGARSG